MDPIAYAYSLTLVGGGIMGYVKARTFFFFHVMQGIREKS